MLLSQCTLSQQTDLVNKKQHTASKDQGREQAATNIKHFGQSYKADASRADGHRFESLHHHHVELGLVLFSGS